MSTEADGIQPIHGGIAYSFDLSSDNQIAGQAPIVSGYSPLDMNQEGGGKKKKKKPQKYMKNKKHKKKTKKAKKSVKKRKSFKSVISMPSNLYKSNRRKKSMKRSLKRSMRKGKKTRKNNRKKMRNRSTYIKKTRGKR